MSEKESTKLLRKAMAPKSDQLNTDDLLTGPIQVSIEKVIVTDAKSQPVSIEISGGYKPWKPCKTMMRVMAGLWTEDTDTWVGK